ncbi:MAG: restriction endonuclease subunit S, partial [Acidobacteria bacterium]|nr:restriction endonuclease subunit S [Acidobacteriota bacterium]
VNLGRQRHPDWHFGDDMRPYLRVANVFEDRIDVSDIMQMDFPPALFERFRLERGDILLNEGQSPEYLGRPAMYRGQPPGAAFTNSLIRFRARPGVDPEWALIVFRRHMHAGRFVQEVRITTNIAHLSAGRFKEVEFPVPPLEEQGRIVAAVKNALDGISRFIQNLDLARKQSNGLRRSLLSEAFAGRLVLQDVTDEPASALLNRIRAERDKVGHPRRR